MCKVADGSTDLIFFFFKSTQVRAAAAGRVDDIGALLRLRGVPINARGYVESSDKHDCPALFAAAAANRIEAVKYLVGLCKQTPSLLLLVFECCGREQSDRDRG